MLLVLSRPGALPPRSRTAAVTAWARVSSKGEETTRGSSLRAPPGRWEALDPQGGGRSGHRLGAGGDRPPAHGTLRSASRASRCVNENAPARIEPLTLCVVRQDAGARDRSRQGRDGHRDRSAEGGRRAGHTGRHAAPGVGAAGGLGTVRARASEPHTAERTMGPLIRQGWRPGGSRLAWPHRLPSWVLVALRPPGRTVPPTGGANRSTVLSSGSTRPFRQDGAEVRPGNLRASVRAALCVASTNPSCGCRRSDQLGRASCHRRES